MEAGADCILEWLNAASGLEAPSLEEFYDCSSLRSILTDTSDSIEWQSLPVGLEGTLQALEHVYQRPLPDASEASANEASRFVRVCKLLLAWTVQCDKKEEYISIILGLSEDSQGSLMVMIEELLTSLGLAGGDEPDEADEAAEEDEAATCAPESPKPSPGADRHSALSSPSSRLAIAAAAADMPLLAGLAARASLGGPVTGRQSVAGTCEGGEAMSPPRRRSGASFKRSRAMLSPATAMSPVQDVPAKRRASVEVGGGRSHRETEIEIQALRQEGVELRKALAAERQRKAAAGASTGGVHGPNSFGGRPSVAGRQSLAVGLALGHGQTGNGRQATGRTSLAGGDVLLSLLSGRLAEDEDEEGDGPYIPTQSSAQEIASLKAALAESDAAKATLNLKISRLEEVARSASSLRDELDVLRPLAAAKERSDAAAERLKAKLEEVPGLRDSLKKAQDHACTLTARVLALEREASRVAPLQALLEAAREARAGAEVRLSEVQSALAEAREAQDELRAALQAASDTGSAVQWAAAMGPGPLGEGGLDAELAGLGFGQGLPSEEGQGASTSSLTEFNPELSERLARLERENCDLRACRDASSEFVLSKLEADLEDARRIKAAFEGSMRQAKGRASELEKELGTARARIADLETSLACRDAELSSCRSVLADTKAALASSEASASALGSRLAQEHAAHVTAVGDAASVREALQASLQQEKASRAALAADLAEYQAAHGTSDAEATAKRVVLEDALRVQEAACTTLQAELVASQEEALSAHGELSAVEDRAAALEGEVDGLRSRMSAFEAQMGADAGQAAAALSALQSQSEGLRLTVARLEAELASERSRLSGLESMKGKGMDMLKGLREDKTRLEGSLARWEVQTAELEAALGSAQEDAARLADQLANTQNQLHTAMLMQEAESERCRRLRAQLDTAEGAVLKARREAGESALGAAAGRLSSLEVEVKRLSMVKDWYASRADVLARYSLHIMAQLTSGPILPACLLREARLPDDVTDRTPDLILVGLGGEAEAPFDAPAGGAGEAAAARTRAKARAGGARRVAIASTAAVDASLAWAAVVDPALRQAESDRAAAQLEAAAALRGTAEIEAERNSLAESLESEKAAVVREGLRYARLTRELEGHGVRVTLKEGAESWLDSAAQGWDEEGEGAASLDASLFELDFGALTGGGEQQADGRWQPEVHSLDYSALAGSGVHAPSEEEEEEEWVAGGDFFGSKTAPAVDPSGADTAVRPPPVLGSMASARMNSVSGRGSVCEYAKAAASARGPMPLAEAAMRTGRSGATGRPRID